MNRINWARITRAMLLVRLGQELGSDSPASRFIFDAISFCVFLGGFRY